MRSFPSGILGESFGGPLQSPKQHPSPQLTSPLALTGSQSDIDKLSQELSAAHVKLASWEQAWSKAKQACDAWKKEADEAGDRARKAEQERLEVVLKMEEVIHSVGPRTSPYWFDDSITGWTLKILLTFAHFYER